MTLDKAASAWDVQNETLEEVSARIHDGVPAHKLEWRAEAYFKHVINLFPHALQLRAAQILEIGSGVGYMLEAIERRTRTIKHRQLIGLDISESMIELAKIRLAQNPYFKSGRNKICTLQWKGYPAAKCVFRPRV